MNHLWIFGRWEFLMVFQWGRVTISLTYNGNAGALYDVFYLHVGRVL